MISSKLDHLILSPQESRPLLSSVRPSPVLLEPAQAAHGTPPPDSQTAHDLNTVFLLLFPSLLLPTTTGICTHDIPIMFKNAARKIAHNTTIPSLGGKQDLRALQDLITAEKTVLNSCVAPPPSNSSSSLTYAA